MAWYNDSRRHALARRGIRTATHEKPVLKAPLEGQTTKLPIQISIVVPSTEYDKKISSREFQERIKATSKELSDRFGGDTSIRAKGDYTSDGKLITEDVVVIEASMTEKDYLKNKSSLERFIKEKKKDWEQESIGYTFEGDFHIYPKFD
jgi:hypothetical protein